MSAPRPRWYCLRLVVPKQDAPIAARVFHAGGIRGLEERGNPRGLELVGYSESEELLRTIAGEAAALLGRPPGFCTAFLSPYEDDSWRTAWTAHLEPQQLGSRFVLVPTHVESAGTDGRQVIRYEPELAFGDGGHATTRLAAAAVERACVVRPSCRLLDVGAGNGVLSFIAHFCGAEQVLGLEIEPTALEAARRNAELNGVSPGRCRFSSDELESLVEPFDVVVANVEILPLLDLIPRMLPVLVSSGEWLLTGFLRDAAGAVEARLRGAGAEICERRELDEWVLISARPCARGVDE